MVTERQKSKSDELAELKQQLAALKLSLSIVGEHSESSRQLVAKRASTLEKIKELEREIQNE
jgi:antitoxin component HigA of HigAB toxin-antitoxin module